MKQKVISWSFLKGDKTLEETIQQYIEIGFRIASVVPTEYTREPFGTESITKALIIIESRYT